MPVDRGSENVRPSAEMAYGLGSVPPVAESKAQAVASSRPSLSCRNDTSHEKTPRSVSSISTRCSGQVRPRSWDSNASAMAPMGSSPSQPRQGAMGASQRPSASSTMW